MNLKKYPFLLVVFLLSMGEHAKSLDSPSSDKEDPHLKEVFKENNVEGTIVIASLDGKTTYVHNFARAQTRLSPASTFKIANSLIALECKALKDDAEIIKWDGEKRWLEAWNKDQNLETAFKHSCVWAYQYIAQKVGTEQYKAYLKKLNYGNQTPGPELTTFWLANGALEITPFEQIEFLKKVVLKRYPLQEKTYTTLKRIMLQEETPAYKIYWKTGAATKDWKGHGWFVGYLEKGEEIWIFATNILINSMDDLPLREKVTRACLSLKKIL